MAATVASTVHAIGSGATITFPLTISAGQAVYVMLYCREAGVFVYSSSTWNGVNTPANQNGAGTVQGGLIAVDAGWLPGLTGTANLVITLTGSHNDWEGDACIINSPHLTTLLGGTDQYDSVTDGTTSPATLTNTLTANDLQMTCYRVRADLTASLAVGGGQTVIQTDVLTANGNTVMSSYKTGTGSVSSTYTFDDSTFPTFYAWGRVVQGAGGGGGSTFSGLTLLGVG